MYILLVDDHAMFRHSLAFLLSSMRPDVVIDQGSSVEQALKLLKTLDKTPDLAILDLHTGGQDPLAGLMQFRAAAENVPVVVVSADEHPATVHACIELGAFSYVPKSAEVDELTSAIDRILGGGVWLPKPLLTDSFAQAPMESGSAQPEPVTSREAFYKHITARQKDVLRLVVKGMTNKMVGKHLCISDGTVKTHLAHLMALFGVSSRTQLVFELARLGIRLDHEDAHAPL